MSLPDIFDAMRPVVALFEELGIRYYVGGSVASSAVGVPRSTNDADLVAAIEKGHIPVLVSRLQDDFYISAPMISDAVDRKSSFNVIHYESSLKVDVFAVKSRPFDHNSLERIQRMEIGLPDAPLTAWLSSAEDTVLNKLEWYQKTGQSSERQWRDVQGVLKVQSDQLDIPYLRHWAAELKLSDLLEEALTDAGIN